MSQRIGREAGDPGKPVILLLHGFPTSSHMFRHLIPHLVADYYVIAPDLPGYGLSDMPDRKSFSYTFDHLAELIGDFVDQIGLKKFSIYIFDYGAPVGLRVALRFPDRISAIITQNGNAYVEGFSTAWESWQNFSHRVRRPTSVTTRKPKWCSTRRGTSLWKRMPPKLARKYSISLRQIFSA